MSGLLQRLSPSAARLCLQVEHFLRDDLSLRSLDGGFVLGVSGGADSTALLLVLRVLAERWSSPLHVVHVDHCLRPESVAEAAHVTALCRAWHIPCTVRREDVGALARAQGLGLEDAGRAVRYAAFATVQRQCGAAWIATAHHSGDLEEDILLRLLRGAGWPALGGMPAVDAERRLVRPFLWTAPEVLRQMLCEEEITWLEDSSNTSRDFRRNRLRHDVLPLLHRENPALREGLLQLWRQARADAAHWDSLLTAALRRHPLRQTANALVADKTLLRDMDTALRLRLCKHMISLCGGQPRAATLHALEVAWRTGRGGAHFQFAGHVIARIQRGCISVSCVRTKTTDRACKDVSPLVSS